MKLILLNVFLLISGTFFASEKKANKVDSYTAHLEIVNFKIKMPSAKILSERLHNAGFDHFMEKSKIHEELADKEKSLLNLYLYVDTAFNKYWVEMNSDDLLNYPIGPQRIKLLQVFLKDYPEAFELEFLKNLSEINKY